MLNWKNLDLLTGHRGVGLNNWPKLTSTNDTLIFGWLKKPRSMSGRTYKW